MVSGSHNCTSTERSSGKLQDSTARRVGRRRKAKKTSRSGPLRRCCYCRQAVYCSEACFEADQVRHNEMHALRMLFFRDRTLSFWNAVDFECLEV